MHQPALRRSSAPLPAGVSVIAPRRSIPAIFHHGHCFPRDGGADALPLLRPFPVTAPGHQMPHLTDHSDFAFILPPTHRLRLLHPDRGKLRDLFEYSCRHAGHHRGVARNRGRIFMDTNTRRRCLEFLNS